MVTVALSVVTAKFERMATIAVGSASVPALLAKLQGLRTKTAAEMAEIYSTPLVFSAEDHQL